MCNLIFIIYVNFFKFTNMNFIFKRYKYLLQFFIKKKQIIIIIIKQKFDYTVIEEKFCRQKTPSMKVIIKYCKK